MLLGLPMIYNDSTPKEIHYSSAIFFSELHLSSSSVRFSLLPEARTKGRVPGYVDWIDSDAFF
jgi:hypothetical protein